MRGHLVEPVRVSDVADVRIGSLTRYGAVTRDGEAETVEGLVLGLRGANARELVRAVREKLDALTPSLPPGVSLEIFYDRGELVQRAVAGVGQALGMAVVLVVIVLFAFLVDVRAAVVTALALPLSVLGTFLWMRAFDFSANLMSLGGLAIAIGMLVDSSVVVIENVATHLGSVTVDRLPRLHVIHRAVREVATPVTSGTLIIVLVFLPLLTLEGLEGKLFIPAALTIVFALATALALSLTVLPVAASFVMTKGAAPSPGFMRALEAALEWTLARVFRHGRPILIGVAILFVLTGWMYLRIGKIFLPTMDEGNVIVQLEKLPSISLATSIDQDLRVQRALLEGVDEIVGIVARTGSDEIGLDPMGLNQTDAFLVLRPRNEWSVDSRDDLLDRMRKVLDELPGIAYGRARGRRREALRRRPVHPEREGDPDR